MKMTARERKKDENKPDCLAILWDEMGGERAAFFRKMQDLATSRTPGAQDVARHLLEGKGKGLRPLITLLTARLCGYAGEHHLDVAAAIEALHTATLLHDDILDHSTTRRGRTAAHIVWGVPQSLLGGDFLMARAFTAMLRAGSLSLLARLSEVTTVLAEGQIRDLRAAHDLSISHDDYLGIIQDKTARLFEFATEAGGLLAKSSEDVMDALKAYGYHLGMSFQLMDDVLDYAPASEEKKAKVGRDFAERKITYPVLKAYQRANSHDRSFLEGHFSKGSAVDFCAQGAPACEDDSLTRTINMLKHYGGLDDARVLAEDHAHRARKALNVFSSDDRGSFEAILDFVCSQ